MGGYLGMFLQSLAQSNQMALAQQNAARQQQELELEKQKQQNAQQISLADLLSNGATIAPPAGTQPTEMSAMGGVSLTDPRTGSDPSRTVSVGGQQVQIESPEERNASETAQAVSRATALNKIGKIPLPAAGSEAMGGMLPAGTPIDPAHAGYLGTIVAANKRAESAQARLDAQPTGPKIVGHTITADDSGRQVEVQTFSDGTTKEIPLKSRGKTREYAPDTGAAGAKAATANALLLEKRSAIRDYEAATKEENDLNAKRLRLGTALKTGQHYIDKSGNLKSFDSEKLNPDQIAAQHADMRDQYEQATQRLIQVASQKNDAIERAGGHPSVSTEEVASRLRAAHAHNMNVALNPKPPVQPAAAAAPKVTDLGTIKAFAAKSNMPLAAAIRQAQAEGYQVKGAQ